LTGLNPRVPAKLHVDHFTVTLAPSVNTVSLLAELAAATESGRSVPITIVDRQGDTVNALVHPAGAKLLSISSAADDTPPWSSTEKGLPGSSKS
jgi:hypothetical protein